MCKSMIYTTMTTATAVDSGGTIPLGTPMRQVGTGCRLYGSSILLRGAGYYDVKGTVTFTPTSTTADTYKIQLLKDGIPVSGATSSVVSGTATSLPIVAVVRTQCRAESALSLQITAGTATNGVTVDNVALTVEKI